MPAIPPSLRDPADPPQSMLDLEVRRLAVRAIGVRAWVAPMVGVLAACVALMDPQPWRVGVMVAVGSLAVVGASLSARRTAKVGVPSWSIPTNLAGMWWLQLAMVTGTGGLDSPLVPILVPLAFVVGMLEPRSRVVAAIVAAQGVLVLLLTGFQTAGWGTWLILPQLASPAMHARPAITLWVEATVLVIVIGVASVLGLFMRQVFQGVVQEALTARADQLRTWETTSRDLQRLGAEIAHELKNPLSSIKGLATLLARPGSTERSAERLDVLRAEVDRMQVILEEFLTFSRPLAPLSLATVDLGALASEVADLHEGMAAARGVSVEVEVRGRPVPIHADMRKVVQVLVNLIQNAMDASPPGGTVGLSVLEEGAFGVVEVRDEGPGVPPELGARVFEAGVTGKADGSGLGLPVALAIARQHGGTLVLLDAPGGGTLARLTLPRVGPTEGAP